MGAARDFWEQHWTHILAQPQNMGIACGSDPIVSIKEPEWRLRTKRQHNHHND